MYLPEVIKGAKHYTFAAPLSNEGRKEATKKILIVP